MTNSELKVKWSGLSENNITSGYRSLRISTECISDLYIGVGSENKRCLILALPQNKHLDFKRVQKENLSIEYFRDTNFIVLELTDNDYHDLFDDLVLSLYHGMKDIKPVDEYSRYFIQAFHRWSDFFEDKQSDLMSEDIIKGIFGELCILKSLIEESHASDINAVMDSWKGPYGKGNDFELDTKHIEVKTKSYSSSDVRISSEFQLEKPFDKGLDLVVVSVESDFNKGISIRQLILEIRELINQRSGDTSILLRALRETGLRMKNLKDYDGFRFNAISRTTYDCAANDFPKLTKSNIPKEITALNYNLRISALSKFITDKNNF